MVFNRSQAGAMYRAVKLAERYIEENRLDIAERFREGISLIEIARQERVSNGEGTLNENIVRNGIIFFLIGHNGKLKGTHSFEGAMGLSEYQEISRKNKAVLGRGRARLNLLERRGFYGLTQKQKQDGLRNSIIARGQTPWDDTEIQDCISMINNRNSSYPIESRWAGKINRNFIAKAINDKYHNGRPVRNKGSISHIVRHKALYQTL